MKKIISTLSLVLLACMLCTLIVGCGQTTPTSVIGSLTAKEAYTNTIGYEPSFYEVLVSGGTREI